MSAIADAIASLPNLAAFPLGLVSPAPAAPLKALLVVAHPDDESECAALIYRIMNELNGVVDQIVVTNGEGGHNYAAPAARYYGLPLHKKEGRAHLIRVRQKEQLRASRTLGIRHTYFLGQPDTGVTPDAQEALDAWNVPLIHRHLARHLRREAYDVVLVLLPASGTHGHHKAVALLTLDAINRLPSTSRAAVLGASTSESGKFQELTGYPSTRTAHAEPALSFDRHTPLRCHPALDYSIIVNWAVSEHKSQGFFQMEARRGSHERFWLFEAGGEAAQSHGRQFLEKAAA